MVCQCSSSLVSLYVPNSGGDLWWFAVMCGGFGFFSAGLWWFAVVCGDLR